MKQKVMLPTHSAQIFEFAAHMVLTGGEGRNQTSFDVHFKRHKPQQHKLLGSILNVFNVLVRVLRPLVHGRFGVFHDDRNEFSGLVL
jgi:hypothetical protein